MKNNPEIILTVFTPTYNRAHTLKRTYESLCKQSCKDFIWLVVDDGSSDGTKYLVNKWQGEESGFKIQYIYKQNGGMHTAHNTAYANINTLLCTCIDSDDAMADGAVEKIIKKWNEVKNNGYAGIVGLDADFDGKVIGKRFNDGLTETTLSGYYANGGAGDKKIVYQTQVINSYPEYPVFEGEKYVALAYKYLLIDRDYKLAVLNEVLCNVEYQQDGSSNNMFCQYVKNPKGFAFWRTVKMQYPESFKRLVIDCIHYCSSSVIAKNRHCISESPRRLLTVLCMPAGWLLSLYIRKRAGEQS